MEETEESQEMDLGALFRSWQGYGNPPERTTVRILRAREPDDEIPLIIDSIRKGEGAYADAIKAAYGEEVPLKTLADHAANDIDAELAMYGRTCPDYPKDQLKQFAELRNLMKDGYDPKNAEPIKELLGKMGYTRLRDWEVEGFADMQMQLIAPRCLKGIKSAAKS